MRKYISFIIIISIMLIMFLGFMPISNAAKTYKMQVGNGDIQVQSGDEFEVGISVQASAMKSFDSVVYYSNNLKLVDAKLDESLPTLVMIPIDIAKEIQSTTNYKGMGFCYAANKEIQGLTYVKLKFKVSENAQVDDEYEIKFNENDCFVTDKDKEHIDFVNCKIKVIKGKEQENVEKPSNVQVSITPSENVIIEQSQTQQFTATVTGDVSIDKSVTWSVEAAKSSNTKISDDGKLTIGADETSEKVEVKAVSVADSTKSATVTVSIKKKVEDVQKPENENTENENTENGQKPGDENTEEKNKNVKVSIDSEQNVKMKKSETKQFTAKVTGENLTDENVTWSIQGNKSNETKITAKGKLTIGAGETAEKITVIATAVANTSVNSKITVEIEKELKDENPTDGNKPTENTPTDGNKPTENTPTENKPTENKPTQNTTNKNDNTTSKENISQTGSGLIIYVILGLVVVSCVALRSYKKIKY